MDLHHFQNKRSIYFTRSPYIDGEQVDQKSSKLEIAYCEIRDIVCQIRYVGVL